MRDCSECGTSIPENRLRAMPNAYQCVPCLEKMGDVAPMRRYDEVGVDGEIISTFYLKNNYVESQQKRVKSFTIPDIEASEEFQYEFFERPKQNEQGYSLSEAFEEDDEEEESNEESRD
jgi:hypothetical protein